MLVSSGLRKHQHVLWVIHDKSSTNGSFAIAIKNHQRVLMGLKPAKIANYFAPCDSLSLASWDMVFDDHSAGGMAKNSSPGYYPRTYYEHLGCSRSAGKNDPKIISWSRDASVRLFDFAASGATRHQISASLYRDSQFWCRLLTRHAVSTNPKVRSVFVKSGG